MGKSSKDKRDIFYRLAKEQGWRARSAFKLLQADETFNLLDGLERAVDLCAAPGGWSQVLSKRMWEPRTVEERKNVKIIAVDMQGMAPIDGVTELRADITKESTAEEIIRFFEGKKAQIVVSDGAPDVTGLHDWDAYMQAQLLLCALSIATYILEEGGSFMGKVYRAANTSSVYKQLQRFFEDVCVFKPSASRNSSIEAFVVARKFKMPEGHVPCNLITEWHKYPQKWMIDITGKKGEDVVSLPFVGHQCEYDADLSYPLDETYVHHEPVQKPLTAAYQEVIEKTKTMSLKHNSYIVRHDNDLPESYILEQNGLSYSKPSTNLEQQNEQIPNSDLLEQSCSKQMTKQYDKQIPVSDILEQSGSSSSKPMTKLEQHDKQMPTTKQENPDHKENASDQSATSEDDKTLQSEQKDPN